jgi:hypothetical protein
MASSRAFSFHNTCFDPSSVQILQSGAKSFASRRRRVHQAFNSSSVRCGFRSEITMTCTWLVLTLRVMVSTGGIRNGPRSFAGQLSAPPAQDGRVLHAIAIATMWTMRCSDRTCQFLVYCDGDPVSLEDRRAAKCRGRSMSKSRQAVLIVRWSSPEPLACASGFIG